MQNAGLGPMNCYRPNSSNMLNAKFLARPDGAMMPYAIASFSSAPVAPASFAAAKCFFSQSGQPTATAHPTRISSRAL